MGKPSVHMMDQNSAVTAVDLSNLGARPSDETAHGMQTHPDHAKAEELPLRSALPEVRIGTVLGKCLLTEQLGQGSTGLVFRGLHQTLKIPVAVKVLRPTQSQSDRQIYHNLKREAQLLAQLNHPHIVRIWDFEDDPDLPYLVLEYVEGLNLEQLIRQCGRLRLDRAVQIISQVASGLGAAWKIGVIHRDVKPGNILLDKEGHARLADLGQALMTRERLADEVGLTTTTGVIAGTPAYMAPEQFLGSTPGDYRSDIYALGASLYHMVTGRVPFQARSYQELLCKHAREQPVSAHELVPELGMAVSDLLRVLMAKDPNDRYQSYTEVAAALANLCQPGSAPPLAAPTSVPAGHSVAPLPAAPLGGEVSSAEPLPSLEEALAAIQAGDKVRAATLLRAITQHDPRQELAWLRLASVADSPVEVLEALQRVLEINPTHDQARAGIHKARLHAGIAEAKAGNREAARAYLTQVLRREPGKESAWLWLASVARSRREAIACLERVLKINPDNQQARKDIAWHREKLASRAPEPCHLSDQPQ